MKPIRRPVLAAIAAAALLALPATASAADYGHKYGHKGGYGYYGGYGHHGGSKYHKPYKGYSGYHHHKKHHQLSRYQVVDRLLNAGYFNIYRLNKHGRYWKAKVRGHYGHRHIVYIDAYNGHIVRHR